MILVELAAWHSVEAERQPPSTRRGDHLLLTCGPGERDLAQARHFLALGGAALAHFLEPGGIATVFPGVPGGTTASDAPVLLIRLRPGERVKARKGQADYGWGDYVAYSKICTHAGCPASLYEQQTTRLLCPCHQSQFEVLQDAKPVFGPATRSLPKLPLGVVVAKDGSLLVADDYNSAIYRISYGK